MAKYRLLDYTPSPFQALNADGWGYTLTIEDWSWWGLRKRIVTKEVLVPYNCDVDKFFKPKIDVWKRR